MANKKYKLLQNREIIEKKKYKIEYKNKGGFIKRRRKLSLE